MPQHQKQFLSVITIYHCKIIFVLVLKKVFEQFGQIASIHIKWIWVVVRCLVHLLHVSLKHVAMYLLSQLLDMYLWESVDCLLKAVKF